LAEDLDTLDALAAASAPAETAERLEAAVHDLRHRLRNAFAVSSAITLASAREAPEHQAFAAALAQRFSTLSLVQARLLDGPGNASLPQLAAQITGAFAAGPGEVRIVELPAIDLDEQRSRLVGLVVGELCANSVRRGALARGGEPVVLSGTLAGGRLTVEWRERLPDGGQPAAVDEVEDAGKRLLVRMARAHGASLAWEESCGQVHAMLDLAFA
jgi:two-component sensor histidine kinase